MKSESRSNLNWIWSEKLWQSIAGDLENEYAKLLEGKLGARPLKFDQPSIISLTTEHRIEAFVRQLAIKTNNGLLHLGLTSSDLEDTVRHIRILASFSLLYAELQAVRGLLNRKLAFDKTPITAFTHLVPATNTTVKDRFAPTLNALGCVHIPQFTVRGIRGSIGTLHVQRAIGLEQVDLENIFLGLVRTYVPDLPENMPIQFQQAAHQTGDHQIELDFARWIINASQTLGKVANDLRLMVAMGQAFVMKNDIASSAFAGKLHPNPWRFERIVGRNYLIFPAYGQLAQIAQDCALERTLTNQTALISLLEGLCGHFFANLQDFKAVLPELTIIGNDLIPDAELEMLEAVRAGHDRFSAYYLIHNKK